MSIEQLEAEVLKLPADERARLAEKLLESLAGEETDESVEQAWIEEAHRRYQEMLDGAVVGIPADEAIERARERLR